MEPKFTTFRHFRNKSGAVTACCVVNPNTKSMTVGFACFSPEDKHWSKSLGRRIALGRAEKSGWEIEELTEKTIINRKGEEKTILAISNHVITFMRGWKEHNMGFVKYSGKHERCTFEQWFPMFLQDMEKEYKRRFPKTVFSIPQNP